MPEFEIKLTLCEAPAVALIRNRSESGERRDPADVQTEGFFETVVVLEFEHAIPDDLSAMLGSFADGRVPEGCPEPMSWVVYREIPYLHGEGFSVPNSMPVLEWFPAEYQALLEHLDDAGSDSSRRVIDLIRWRFGKLAGSQSPIQFERFEWSQDGVKWSGVPIASEVHEGERLGLILSADDVAGVQEIADRGVDIPFAHVLLREAWELRITNPRSSILVGVAAAEIGLKQAIQTLVPGASYIVEKFVLPQMADLLKNYVPTLPVKLKFGAASPEVPEWVRKAIWEAVENRNKLAHRPIGATGVIDALKFENVTTLLQAVHDLLVLLEYHCGNEWAETLLSDESRVALKLPALPPKPVTFPVLFASPRRHRMGILLPEAEKDAPDPKLPSSLGRLASP